ncbi:DUF427 domain-containing protein [Streptomyces sp. NPDC048603]|uniref:DUF427 domain-containing protein n=1 Tax=Streptomyces sp. NPDC048603 TaxID=3365577 RepID=UPI00371F4D86
MTDRSRWEPAPDGGKPERRTCTHLDLPADPADALRTPADACRPCLLRGWSWVRLRRCLTCGHIGCCDSSRGRHAYAHHVSSGHPVVVSLAPDEDWAWCYPDGTFLVRTGQEEGPQAVESVWDYPRPPRIDPDTRHVVVRHGGVVLADSRRCLRVLETSHPPGFYVPRADVRTGLLSPSRHRTVCEWKGTATYWDLRGSPGRPPVPGAAWSYEAPAPGYEPIAGHLAFHPDRVDACTVDGEPVRAQPGGFYGGWITGEITGPFKGAPGTSGW